ncbi:MAG: type II toxin-antitoxin system RelE/ParE family toxin [Bacteroidota bacterium]
MLEIIIAPSARLDLYEIWEHAVLVSEVRATALLSRINAQFERIAAFPQLGRTRPEVDSDARSILVDRYVVFYRVQPDSVEIVRVVHSRQDLDTLFGSS